jgi:hypothetical protein
MKKLPIIIAAVSTLSVFPAFAGQPEAGSQASESMRREQGMPHSMGMNRDYGERNYGERKSYGYEREGRGDREGDSRYRHAQGMQEGCKYITVRQRRGDEVVVRHFRRCD